MLRIIKGKLKASSMMESVVALVVISTIFVLSFSIFLNVADFSFSMSEVNASLVLNDVSIETKKTKSFFNEEINKESLIIKKEIVKYKGLEDVFWLHLEALTLDGKSIVVRNELIHENEKK